MKINKKIGLSVLAISCLFGSAAFADSQLLPGISTGIPLGAPLPQGKYMVTIPTSGSRDNVQVDALVPAWMIWSTPWTVAGGRVMFEGVTPYAKVTKDGNKIVSGFLNPLVGGMLKWDLGKGWFGGVQAGAYIPVSNDIANDFASFQGIGAISYLGEGKNLSATAIYGTGKDSAKKPDWMNIDLTATQKIGKWELGAVAFSSNDLNNASGKKQSQIAAGPLVGYNFGKINVQAKYTNTLDEKNYGADEKRFWVTIVTPLSSK